MDKLVYGYYLVLVVILFWGAKIYGRKKWNDEFMSLKQTKVLQGFFALCIMFHHISQKTCAHWLNPRFIRHGLDIFVESGYLFVSIFLFCSGYGLLKSFNTKPDYLKGFVKRRVLPVVIGYYTTGIIFLIIRLLMGEKLKTKQIIYYITGIQLSNPNTWFVIALPIFYLGFYFAFRFIKNKNIALFVTCLVVFGYTLIGTFTDHNDFWFRGEWWYNCVHLFSVGLLFAKFEKGIIERVKKHYFIYLVLTVVLFIVFNKLSESALSTFSYYREQWPVKDQVVLSRWVCLLSQMAVSCTFTFSVFMLNMKIKIGNRFLAFMGTITLEFYLIHGLFVELFGFSFINDNLKSLYYIKNVALMVVVVFVLAVPSALLLKKLHQIILRTGKKKI